jgi:hypothetical protein
LQKTRRGHGENLFQPLFPALIKLQKTTHAFLQFNQCRKSRAVSPPSDCPCGQSMAEKDLRNRLGGLNFLFARKKQSKGLCREWVSMQMKLGAVTLDS